MAQTVYSRALQKAAEILGSQQKLSRRLQVPARDLQDWIDDKSAPPTPIFLKVVDLILEEIPPPAASDPADTPAPRDAAPDTDSRSSHY